MRFGASLFFLRDLQRIAIEGVPHAAASRCIMQSPSLRNRVSTCLSRCEIDNFS